MASHDDARADSARTRRHYRPHVDSQLERREVMSATPLATGELPPTATVVAADSPAPIATTTATPAQVNAGTDPAADRPVVVTALETTPESSSAEIATTSVTAPTAEILRTTATRRNTSPRASSADWQTMADWSWLSGTWKSNTKIDFMQTLARSMGARNTRFPSIPSMDTWIVGKDSYVGRTALGAQNQAMPLDGLVIKPGGGGRATTLSMTSADGTPPVDLPLTAVKGGTVTFAGSTPIFETATAADGKEVTTTATGAPVRVNVTRRNDSSMRITSEMLTGGKWIRMFTYTATKTKAAKV